jgi:hypothetical protein
MWQALIIIRYCRFPGKEINLTYLVPLIQLLHSIIFFKLELSEMPQSSRLVGATSMRNTALRRFLPLLQRTSSTTQEEEPLSQKIPPILHTNPTITCTLSLQSSSLCMVTQKIGSTPKKGSRHFKALQSKSLSTLSPLIFRLLLELQLNPR